jgi:enoyl-[acyl-carrier-protein] reductase (NADH)
MVKVIPAYMEVYFDDLGRFLNLSRVQTEVLKLLVREYYSENIRITSNKINNICFSIGINRNSLKNILCNFIKSKVLIRKRNTVYALNPLYNPMNYTKGAVLTITYIGSKKYISLAEADNDCR